MRRALACALAVTAGCGRVGYEPFVDVGCASGVRDAFIDQSRFPRIAGCEATWTGQIDLRGPVAAAVCAPHWHVCGLAGDPTEISTRATAADCLSAGDKHAGAYLMAMQHCSLEDTAGCHYDSRTAARLALPIARNRRAAVRRALRPTTAKKASSPARLDRARIKTAAA